MIEKCHIHNKNIAYLKNSSSCWFICTNQGNNQQTSSIRYPSANNSSQSMKGFGQEVLADEVTRAAWADAARASTYLICNLSPAAATIQQSV